MIVYPTIRMGKVIAPERNQKIGVGLDAIAVPGRIGVGDGERVVLDQHAVIARGPEGIRLRRGRGRGRRGAFLENHRKNAGPHHAIADVETATVVAAAGPHSRMETMR